MTLFNVEEQAVKIVLGEAALLDRGLCVLVRKKCLWNYTAMPMETFHKHYPFSLDILFSLYKKTL